MAKSNNKRKSGKMKGKVAVQNPAQRAQGPIKQRIALLEKIQSDAVDQIIREIQRIDRNVLVLANAMDEIDMNHAVMRSLSVDKKLFTDAEFDQRKKELIERKAMVMAEQRKRQAEKEAEEKKLSEEQAAHPGVDPELIEMKQKAEAVAVDPNHPDGAFIFGG